MMFLPPYFLHMVIKLRVSTLKGKYTHSFFPFYFWKPHSIFIIQHKVVLALLQNDTFLCVVTAQKYRGLDTQLLQHHFPVIATGVVCLHAGVNNTEAAVR